MAKTQLWHLGRLGCARSLAAGTYPDQLSK
jgi:hypothetical protein